MNKRVRNIILNIIFILVCAGIAYGISEYMFASIPVDGISMEQTLHDGDKIILYRVGKYKYGDVIVFNSHMLDANNREKYLVKRIIGLPGDTIEIKRDPVDNKLYTYRNGEKLIEDYINPEKPMKYEMSSVTVGDGEFFYMGDNRSESSDSRSGTLGRLDSILGRVILRYTTADNSLDIDIIKRIQ